MAPKIKNTRKKLKNNVPWWQWTTHNTAAVCKQRVMAVWIENFLTRTSSKRALHLHKLTTFDSTPSFTYLWAVQPCEDCSTLRLHWVQPLHTLHVTKVTRTSLRFHKPE